MFTCAELLHWLLGKWKPHRQMQTQARFPANSHFFLDSSTCFHSDCFFIFYFFIPLLLSLQMRHLKLLLWVTWSFAQQLLGTSNDFSQGMEDRGRRGNVKEAVSYNRQSWLQGNWVAFVESPFQLTRKSHYLLSNSHRTPDAAGTLSICYYTWIKVICARTGECIIKLGIVWSTSDSALQQLMLLRLFLYAGGSGAIWGQNSSAMWGVASMQQKWVKE